MRINNAGTMSARLRFLALMFVVVFTAGAYEVQVDVTGDASIVSNKAGKNYGAATTLLAGGNNRFLVSFPADDSIPYGAILDSAKLYLYTATNTQTVDGYRVMKNWYEGLNNDFNTSDGEVDWGSAMQTVQEWTTAGCNSTAGGSPDREATATTTYTIGTANQYYDADVTTVVQFWEAIPDSNFGLWFTTGGAITFDSKEGANPPYAKLWFRVPPVITGLSASATLGASQTDSSTVIIQYEVTDFDEDSVDITAEYQLQGSSWVSMTLAAISGDTGRVDTSATNDKTILWDLNAETGIGDGKDSTVTVRLIVTDDSSNVDMVTSAVFVIDTRNPAALAGNLVTTDTLEDAISLQWGVSSDSRFSHYEIWYGTIKSNVGARNISAYEWDARAGADPLLSAASTDTTTIQGLEYNTKYYFKIWAQDSAGNEVVGTMDSATTKTSDAPQVTGWEPSPLPSAVQVDTELVYIRYEVADLDDGTVTITVNVRVNGGNWTDLAWANVRDHMSGDTGKVLTSPTEQRTIIWDAEAELGAAIDDLYDFMIIADDGDGNIDTAISAQAIVDTRLPTAPGAFTAADSTSRTVRLTWTASTDNHFNHYEIWYGTNQTEVESRGVAAEWDNDPNDADLAVADTTSTTITGLLTNTQYYFRIWAVDDYGNEITPVAPTSIIKNTDSTDYLDITAIDDNMLSSASNTTNFGSESSRGGATSGKEGPGDTRRTALKITGLNQIPAGATITSAILKAYALLVQRNGDVYAYMINVDWAENTSTWDSPWTNNGVYNAGDATDCNTGAAATATVNAVDTWFSWDLTSQVRGWRTGDTVNYGVLFRSADEGTNNSHKNFSSSEGAYPPYLAVQYTMEFPAVTGLSAAAYLGATQVGNKDTVTVSYEISDPTVRDSILLVELEYWDGNSWETCTDISGDIGDVEWENSWDNKFIYWGVRAQFGSSTDMTSKVRIIVTDSSGLQDTTESALFGVDTKNPVGLDVFYVNDSSSYYMDLAWDSSVTIDNHFSHYEIWYGSVKTEVESQTGGAVKWDALNAPGLRNAETKSTRVNNLSSSTLYYFHIWAVDSMNNTSDEPTVWATTLEDPIPTVTGWGGAALINAKQIDPDTVRVGFEVIDMDDTIAVCSLIYNDGTWKKPTYTYVTGNYDTILTGASYDDTLYWDVGNDMPGGTDGTFKMGVHCVDTSMGLKDTTESANIFIDKVSPQNMASLSLDAITATTARFSWTAANSESHFNTYRIWYGTVLADVQARSGASSPLDWDKGNHTALGTLTQDSTKITGLVPSTPAYYFQIWALDSAGNADSIAWVTGATLATDTPSVTGWDEAPNVGMAQTSVSNVSVYYEADDQNGGNVNISAEYKVLNGVGWTAFNGASVAGDYGSVAVSATLHRTIVWNVTTDPGLGSVDTVYTVRVIADDAGATNYRDTTSTDTMAIDSKNPSNMASFTCTDTTGTTVSFTWGQSSDRNWNHYELWYGPDQAKVNNRNTVGPNEATEWDDTQDINLLAVTTTSTKITGLSENTTYWFSVFACDDIGNCDQEAAIQVMTKNEIGTKWSVVTIPDAIRGGSLGEGRMYVCSDATDYTLRRFETGDGSQKWTKAMAAYQGCNMPTYSYFGGAYNLIFSTGTNQILACEDQNTLCANLWGSPKQLTSAAGNAGNPYLAPDDSTFFILYDDTITQRRLSNGSTKTDNNWPKYLSGLNEITDIVVHNDNIYVAAGNFVYQYGYDGTQSGSFNAGAAVNLPLIIVDTALYITPNSANICAANSGNMQKRWNTNCFALNPANANTGPAFSVNYTNKIYVAAGASVQRYTDNGVGIAPTKDWDSPAGGNVKGGPITKDSIVYFSTDEPKYYAIEDNNTDDGPVSLWPFGDVSGSADQGPWIDPSTSTVVFSSTGGDLDGFTIP